MKILQVHRKLSVAIHVYEHISQRPSLYDQEYALLLRGMLDASTLGKHLLLQSAILLPQRTVTSSLMQRFLYRMRADQEKTGGTVS